VDRRAVVCGTLAPSLLPPGDPLRCMAVLLLSACGPAFVAGSPEGQVWEDTQVVALTVRVRTPADEPASGVWVSLTPGGWDALTDSSGEARFETLEPGTFTGAFTVPGSPRQERTITLEADTRVTWTAPAPPVPQVRGHVVDAAGVPVFGALVTLEGEQTTTDTEGGFALDAPGAGRVSLRVEGTRGGAGRFVTDQLDLTAGADAQVWVTLPGEIDADAQPIGSQVCAACHADAAADWADTAHAHAPRRPRELADEPIGQAVGGPDSRVRIGAETFAEVIPRTDGEWVVVVFDSGGSTRFYDVERVIGGHGVGAALTALEDGHEIVLPIAWATQGEGLGEGTEGAFVPAWTQGWVDGDGMLAPTPTSASWGLSCAGCHTTGGALVSEGDGYTLDRAGDVPVEPVVGCEACHGDGSYHRRYPSRRQTSIIHPARLDGGQQLDVCARCHARVDTADHPFDDAPAWPVTSTGRLPVPTAPLTPQRDVYAGVFASRVFADQVGDLRNSPHHAREYRGACSDCHVAHGSDHPADLRAAPRDNDLCTTCHLDLSSAFDQAEHNAHKRFAPGPWAPGACVDCHLPRAPLVLRRDPLSGVGEQRAHTLTSWSGHDTVAAFAEAGTERLEPGQVAVPACLDCHLQAAERMQSQGLPFLGPLGDPYVRATHDNLGLLQDRMWGSQ